MKIICDHCESVIGESEYEFSINHKHYYACSAECFKNLLHKQGINTYPSPQLPIMTFAKQNQQVDAKDEVQKKSLFLSSIALFLSFLALIINFI